MIRQSSSTVIRLADIINEYEQDFIEKYKQFLLPGHFKALKAIKLCRSEASPIMRLQCENEACAHHVYLPHSCGHRHCPHCQNHETEQWIQKQLQKQVPAEYFMITFTLPAQFRMLVWFNQRLLYSILFQCVWDTLKSFALNHKKLGGTPGAIAVLHTQSRALNFHPHIHIVMPAATIDGTKRLWAEKGGKYLFCHKALARVFRAKMLHALSCHGLNLPHAYPEDWVADCKHVGKGNKALVYLGQYLYRGVIKEKDILSCRDGKVTFRYKNSKMNAENSRSTNKYQTRTVSAVHFLWLVMQHVLPRGFRRARNFGFLHPNSKKMIRIIQWMFRLNVQKRTAKPRIKMKCPCCGHAMRVVDVLLPAGFRLPIPKPA